MPLPWPLRLFSRAPEAPAPAAAPPATSDDDRFDEDGLPLGPVERARRLDGYRDPYAGIGYDRDPRTAIDFIADLVTDEEAIETLRGEGIASKIAEKPVTEGLRPGFDLAIAEREKMRGKGGETSGTDERPADKLKSTVTAEWRRLGAITKLEQALVWERARGGSVVLGGFTDFATKPHEKPAKGAKLEWLRVIAARDLCPDRHYSDPHAEKFGEVEIWRLNTVSKNGATTAAPTILVHESRLIVLAGRRVTDEQLPGQQQGFGDSCFMLVKAAARRYASALDSLELTLRRNGEPWWAVKDLANLLATDKGGGFKGLLAAHERARAMLKLRVVDAEDKFGMTAAPLAGLREVTEVFEREVAAVADMPASIIFGELSAGIGDGNSGARGDWHDTCEAWAKKHAIPRLEVITRWIMAGLGGEAEQWTITQPSRKQLSEKEQGENTKLEADTDIALVNAAIITPRDVARREIWQMRYQLENVPDASEVVEMPDDIRETGEPEADPASPDPGAPAVDATGKSTEVQATALNGAQVAAMLGVIKSVAAGEIPREAAIELVLASIPSLPRDQAARMIGPEGFEAAAKPVPPAFGAPPPPQDPPPADKPKE